MIYHTDKKRPNIDLMQVTEEGGELYNKGAKLIGKPQYKDFINNLTIPQRIEMEKAFRKEIMNKENYHWWNRGYVMAVTDSKIAALSLFLE